MLLCRILLRKRLTVLMVVLILIPWQALIHFQWMAIGRTIKKTSRCMTEPVTWMRRTGTHHWMISRLILTGCWTVLNQKKNVIVSWPPLRGNWKWRTGWISKAVWAWIIHSIVLSVNGMPRLMRLGLRKVMDGIVKSVLTLSNSMETWWQILIRLGMINGSWMLLLVLVLCRRKYRIRSWIAINWAWSCRTYSCQKISGAMVTKRLRIRKNVWTLYSERFSLVIMAWFIWM